MVELSDPQAIQITRLEGLGLVIDSIERPMKGSGAPECARFVYGLIGTIWYTFCIDTDGDYTSHPAFKG